ncbi:hypothetical protein [Nonomuraea rosea]|uniref:hypothetical protein n=1 Tax=Nonomuraea rosea TaxID=638574 RepID=UPI0031E8C119
MTRSGRTWQLDDAAEGTPVDLSADGRYLAYARATDQRVVVRDLAAGTVLPIQESVRADDLEGRELVPTLLSDGRHLLVTVRVTYSPDDEAPLPPAFIVNLADGRTLWHLPQDGTLARLDQDGTRLMVTDERALSTLDSSGTKKVPLPARLRTPAAFGALVPDGSAQAAQVVSRNPAAGGSDIRPSRLVTIDTRDGKVLHDVRLRLPLRDRASVCDTTQGVNASEVLLSCATGKLFEEITFRVGHEDGHVREGNRAPSAQAAPVRAGRGGKPAAPTPETQKGPDALSVEPFPKIVRR